MNAEVERIPGHSPEVRLLAKQVMPDHLHILLHVVRPMDVHLGKVIGRFKAGCNRGMREITEKDAERDTAQLNCAAPNTPGRERTAAREKTARQAPGQPAW